MSNFVMLHAIMNLQIFTAGHVFVVNELICFTSYFMIRIDVKNDFNAISTEIIDYLNQNDSCNCNDPTFLETLQLKVDKLTQSIKGINIIL